MQSIEIEQGSIVEDIKHYKLQMKYFNKSPSCIHIIAAHSLGNHA